MEKKEHLNGELPRCMNRSHLAGFIHAVSCQKKAAKDWVFMHLKVLNAGEGFNLGEIVQVLDFSFQKEKAHIIAFDAISEVMVLTTNHEKKPFSVMERPVRENFPNLTIEITTVNLTEKGVEQIGKVLGAIVSPDDLPSKIGLTRLSRNANVSLVLDDDQMILKQMEKILGSVGHVETLATAETLFPLYSRYAPNVVFVDIHLKKARGTDVLQGLLEKVDPYAHAVMITADAIKENVLESKYKGARGFVSKPVNVELTLRHVMSSPTFCPKNRA